MSQPDTRRLTCTSCQHANEIERVYCHNCGEKLDRSLLPKIDDSKPVEDKAKASRKVKKLMNPNRFNWWMNLKTLLLVEFLAVLVAAGYLIVQPPAFAVPLSKEKIPDLEVGDMWSEMLRQRTAVSLSFKEYDVNYYLAKLKGSTGAAGKFERAFAHFEKDSVTLATQRSVLGLTICNSASFKPVPDGLKWKAAVSRLSIGRLAVPMWAAKLIGLESSTLGPFAQVFDKDIRQLDRLEKIESGEGTISFITRQQK